MAAPTGTFLVDGAEYGALNSGLYNASTNTTIVAGTGRSPYEFKIINSGVSSAGSIQRATSGSPTVSVQRVWFKAIAFPVGGNQEILRFGSNVDVSSAARVLIGTSGIITYALQGGVAQTPGVTWALGDWHMVESRLAISGGNYVMDVTLDGISYAQTTAATSAGSVNSVFIGPTTSRTAWEYRFDDWIASQAVSSDYPIGNGTVRACFPDPSSAVVLSPDPEDCLVGQDSTAITAANVYSYLDAAPPIQAAVFASMTKAIKVTNAHPAHYVEIGFLDITSGNSFNAVEVMLVATGAASSETSAPLKAKLNDGTLVLGGTNSWSSGVCRASRCIVTPPAGGWTMSEVNALRAQIGFGIQTGTVNHLVMESVFIQYDVAIKSLPTNSQRLQQRALLIR